MAESEHSHKRIGLSTPNRVINEWIASGTLDEPEIHDLQSISTAMATLCLSENGRHALAAVCCAVLNRQIEDSCILLELDNKWILTVECVNGANRRATWARFIETQD